MTNEKPNSGASKDAKTTEAVIPAIFNREYKFFGTSRLLAGYDKQSQRPIYSYPRVQNSEHKERILRLIDDKANNTNLQIVARGGRHIGSLIDFVNKLYSNNLRVSDEDFQLEFEPHQTPTEEFYSVPVMIFNVPSCDALKNVLEGGFF